MKMRQTLNDIESSEKEKKPVHSSDDKNEELDEDAARVYIFFNFKLYFSFAKLIFYINIRPK